jgi:hypothetical protein
MRFLSLLLSSLVALNPLWAQTGSAVPTASATADLPLRVQLVDDPGPSQPKTTSAKGFVLQVTNSNGSPVSGAAVALSLPEDGTTGRFSNGLRAWVAYSDNAGIARFPSIQWGEAPGDIQLKVTAAKGTSHAALLIGQRVSMQDTTSLSVVSVPMKAAPAPSVILSLPEIRSRFSPKPLTVDQASVEAAAVKKPALPPLPAENAATPQPGSVFKPLADVPPMNASNTGATAPKEKSHALTPDPPPPVKQSPSEPTVTITNTGAGGSESHKKTWIIVGIAAGAGAAAMLAVMGHSSGAAAAGAGSSSGVTVGSPTITIGH